MFQKFFSAFAVAAVCAVGFVACNSDQVPAPAAAPMQHFSANDASEIEDDYDPNARAAPIILKENKVYQVFKVTGACSFSATPNAEFALTQGSITATTLADSLTTSAKGWSRFSVKPEKFNTYIKKTVDKTKDYTIYVRDRGAKNYKRLGNINSDEPRFVFLPNYNTNLLTMSCSGISDSLLN